MPEEVKTPPLSLRESAALMRPLALDLRAYYAALSASVEGLIGKAEAEGWTPEELSREVEELFGEEPEMVEKHTVLSAVAKSLELMLVQKGRVAPVGAKRRRSDGKYYQKVQADPPIWEKVPDSRGGPHPSDDSSDESSEARRNRTSDAEERSRLVGEWGKPQWKMDKEPKPSGWSMMNFREKFARGQGRIVDEVLLARMKDHPRQGQEVKDRYMKYGEKALEKRAALYGLAGGVNANPALVAEGQRRKRELARQRERNAVIEANRARGAANRAGLVTGAPTVPADEAAAQPTDQLIKKLESSTKFGQVKNLAQEQGEDRPGINESYKMEIEVDGQMVLGCFKPVPDWAVPEAAKRAGLKGKDALAHKEPSAEYGCFLVDRALGLNRVPNVALVVHKNKVGSWMQWCKGARPAHYVRGWKAKVPEEEKRNCALFDMLVSHSDRHEKNFMIYDDGKVGLIDNGYSLGTRGTGHRVYSNLWGAVKSDTGRRSDYNEYPPFKVPEKTLEKMKKADVAGLVEKMKLGGVADRQLTIFKERWDAVVKSGWVKEEMIERTARRAR